jgi:hypothetical protein
VVNGSLHEVVELVLAAPGSEDLLVDISGREDLREFAAAAASNIDLFCSLTTVVADQALQEVVRSSSTAPRLVNLLLEISRRNGLRLLAEAAASNVELFAAASALVADVSLQEVVRSTVTTPGLADLLLEFSRRDDLKELTKAACGDVALAVALSELAKTDGALLFTLTEIIRTANGTATDSQERSLVTQ